MFASGYWKMKFAKNFSNVITIEDYDSHAKAHNMILKSDNIVIVGEGFEAIQLAASIRSYLDSLSIYTPKIAILSEKESYLKYLSTVPEEHIK